MMEFDAFDGDPGVLWIQGVGRGSYTLGMEAKAQRGKPAT